MAEQQQFYLLLGNLMSPDNNVRKHSEVRERKYGHLFRLRLGECWDDYAKKLIASLPSLSARCAFTSSPRAL